MIIGSVIVMELLFLRNSLAMVPEQFYATVGATMVPQLLLLAGPILIPSAMNMLLAQLHLRDQNRGSIIPLLCAGVRPGFAWSARLLVTFCAVYAMLLISIGLIAVIIRIVFRIPVLGGTSLWIAILISSPLAALVLPSLSFLLAWISRRAMMVSSYIPILIYVLGVTLYKMHLTAPKNPLMIIHATAGIAVVLITLLAIAADCVPIDRIVGLR
jgi:hypothetical protein